MQERHRHDQYRAVIFAAVANAVHAEMRRGAERGLVSVAAPTTKTAPSLGLVGDERPPERCAGFVWEARLVTMSAEATYSEAGQRVLLVREEQRCAYEWERVSVAGRVEREMQWSTAKDRESVESHAAAIGRPLVIDVTPNDDTVIYDNTLADAAREFINRPALLLPAEVAPPCGATRLDGAGVAHFCLRPHHEDEEHDDGAGYGWRQGEAA